MLKKMLEKAGYSVLDASNGAIGLKIFLNNTVDLVITDIVMPEREGLETIRDLKKNNPDIKIIAMSGGGSIGPTEYLSLAKRFGVERTLKKPFTMKEVLTTVGELISQE
jgi:YesN/AraC family two-component response regulator